MRRQSLPLQTASKVRTGRSTTLHPQCEKLSPFIRPPADAPILVATEDEPLALLLNAAPKLQRSVIVIKEHALSDGTAALSILTSLSENGLNAIGVRLCHLPSALGSSAQLGLDTPLSSGPVLAVLVDGHEPTDRIQALAGASDPKLARSTDVGSWRAKLGIDRKQSIATPRHAKARSALLPTSSDRVHASRPPPPPHPPPPRRCQPFHHSAVCQGSQGRL